MKSRISFIGKLLSLSTILVLTGCSYLTPGRSAPTFQHGFSATPRPWTHERFDDAEDKFTFAIVRNGRDYIMLGTTGGGQRASNDMSFDHVSLVTMTEDGPSIGNLKLSGILNKTGHIPAGGDSLCFQASRCGDDSE